MTAGISTFWTMLENTGPNLQETAGLALGLVGRSQRIVGRLLCHSKSCTMGQESQLLGEYSQFYCLCF